MLLHPAGHLARQHGDALSVIINVVVIVIKITKLKVLLQVRVISFFLDKMYLSSYIVCL